MEPLTFQSMNFERIPTDVETTKTRALQNAERALRAHEQHKQAFDTSALPGARSLANPALSSDMERPQPSIFEGKLKGYQLKVSSRQTKQSIFYVHVHVQSYTSFTQFRKFNKTVRNFSWASNHITDQLLPSANCEICFTPNV